MRAALVLFSLVILWGCAGAPESQSIGPNEQSTDQTAIVEKKRNDVFWSLQEVRHLSELEGFMDGMAQNVTDSIRVETVTKEGEPHVLDLLYDGESLRIKTNGRDEQRYHHIIVSSRYSEHYGGEFIEYWAVDEEDGNRMLILQIHPDLHARLDSFPS